MALLDGMGNVKNIERSGRAGTRSSVLGTSSLYKEEGCNTFADDGADGAELPVSGRARIPYWPSESFFKSSAWSILAPRLGRIWRVSFS